MLEKRVKELEEKMAFILAQQSNVEVIKPTSNVKQCKKCGNKSHNIEKCIIDTSNNTCFGCNKKGHLRPACPEKVQCYNCNNFGHYAPDCPN